MRNLKVIVVDKEGEELLQCMSAVRDDTDDLFHAGVLERPIRFAGIFRETGVKSRLIKRRAATGFVFRHVAGLNVQVTQHLDSRLQRFNLRLTAAGKDITVYGRQVESQFLLKTGETHGELGADDAFIDTSGQGHQYFQLRRVLVAATGEENGISAGGEVKILRPAGTLLLATAEDVLFRNNIFSEVS